MSDEQQKTAPTNEARPAPAPARPAYNRPSGPRPGGGGSRFGAGRSGAGSRPGGFGGRSEGSGGRPGAGGRPGGGAGFRKKTVRGGRLRKKPNRFHTIFPEKATYVDFKDTERLTRFLTEKTMCICDDLYSGIECDEIYEIC